jgi:hypothetical protein
VLRTGLTVRRASRGRRVERVRGKEERELKWEGTCGSQSEQQVRWSKGGRSKVNDARFEL